MVHVTARQTGIQGHNLTGSCNRLVIFCVVFSLLLAAIVVSTKQHLALAVM